MTECVLSCLRLSPPGRKTMVGRFSEIDSQVDISCKKFETASIKVCFVGIKLDMCLDADVPELTSLVAQSTHPWRRLQISTL